MYVKPKHKFNQETNDWILKNAEGKLRKEAHALFLQEFNLDISYERFKRQCIRLKIPALSNGQFKKGHVPATKGTRGVYNVGGNRTSFKKGHKTHNYRPVGSERITKDGYIKVKVADPNVWKLKHRLVYEEHHGPIPEGMYVAFLDQNPQNLEISNLILITKKESVRLNTNHYLQKRDGRINLAYIGLVKLQNKIREKGKRHGN